jgi:CheY-like chemotaxis protein
METASKRPLILYAEDDYDDFESVKEALDQLNDQYEIRHAKDGSAVIPLLEQAGRLPDLIVLDLNMPIMDGKEVLIRLKQENDYKDIPVMIFTTSSREDDVKLCQKYHCTFFRKPTLYRDLLHVAQTMLDMCQQHISG